jgi:glycosyltransferase involved in cell wall biosynthesis
MKTSPRRVLLTTDVVGGVWDFTVTLAEALRPLGWEPTLLAIGTPSPAQMRQTEAASLPLRAVPLRLEWMQDSDGDVAATRAAAHEAVADLRPDVVQANQFAVATAHLPVPVVLTAHSDVLSWRRWVLREDDQADLPPEWAAYASLVRCGLQAADGAVSVSHFLACELRQLYRLTQPLHVIHNGWPDTAPPPSPLACRPRLTVLAGRAWDPAKNVCLPAEIAHGWPEVGRVVLAGSQRHPDSGATVELPSPVESLGFVSHTLLTGYLRQARAYVSAAHYDPFGLLPLQAALAGCPLLLADIPSYRELWDDVALFFPPDDPQALRQQWQRVLDDTVAAAARAQQARARAQQQYAATAMARAYAALYEQAIAQQASRAIGQAVPA